MYRTLIDAQALAAHLDDPAYVVVDCRHALADHALGRRLYEHSHIAGALFADVERDLSGTKTGTNGRHPLPDPQAFAAFLRSIGVSAQTQLVAYDAGGDMFASRLWFLARWIGHDACAVLDGGFAAWSAAGYPVESGEARPRAAGTIEPRLRDDLVVPASYVLEHLHDDSMTLVDARASDRFAGQNETVDPVAGHIPGARNHFFKENFEADGRFKSPDVLRAALAPYGSSDRVVHQCGSGVSGAVNLLAMEIAGAPGSRLYAGSWSEWIADPSRPIVTGNA
jgi:thiosulfate/3-mercaptopyruvate sulfurtransferase